MKKFKKNAFVFIGVGVMVIAVYMLYIGLFQKKESYYAYVSNASDGTISVIDTKNNEFLNSIKVGERASDGIATSVDGKYIYAGDISKGEVVIIDAKTEEVIKRLDTGVNVHGLDMTPDGKKLYVASGDLKEGVQYNYVLVIDTYKNEIVDRITSNWKSPAHIDFSKDGKVAYVSNVMSNEVAIIDISTNKIIKKIPVGKIPNETEPSLDGKLLYVANVGDGTVSIIDLESYNIVSTIKAGKGTHGLAVSSDDKYIWVANRNSNDVVVIDSNTKEVVKSIKVLGTPNHISVVPNSNEVYVTNKDSGEITVIDMKDYKVIKKIKVGNEPHEIAFSLRNND